ncbi:H-NS family nucleoid-associated regulatory protein [Mannheimia varigena]|uniref:DNA-binding protein n=1 Tax=Mannheimia varigena USDA-ARS-USMARC-1296 TaxID=1433287 RepID=W0QA48_9PAST|nr:H-NS family nucleoid-associated regulatory protein [Mannheimia varigena]AHG75754.1 DNA-binding protein H-NS [Mannheimia varigena USDA-ARS-USMARC-1296]AHG77778.1 DNA-binding protein H-NS [Mannheimia varigena USDA-ARS-USMARC-1312]AHG79551.1 DNA-binding protein H-NS [Mannheimia varigena USDA-ARS-USMARC-1388]TLU76362.1 DNA-binding protein H-NS-like protein [Mannheimia varigena]
MSDLKSLLNIRTLRALAKDLALEQLRSIAEKLDTIIAEKEEEIRKEEQERAKQLESLNKYTEMLKQDGLSIDELAQLLADKVIKGRKTAKARKAVAPRPAKYKFVDAEGNEKTWTGQGRTPKALQKALDKGKKLEDFAI